MMLPLPVIAAPPTRRNAPQIVEVAFKGNRTGYFTTGDEELRIGDYVVVEVQRGHDLGRVKSVGGIAARKCAGCSGEKNTDEAGNPTFAVLRPADPDEVQRLMTLRADEERVRRRARELAGERGLRMKMTDAEWQWDRSKLTLYFTAERRVDFRQLVRDLARAFRARIELRQIGVRDEAALLGGVGRCGRELCCSTWLREIKPISLQLAKDQNLSLNPAQISGTCGRLMCCLTYEHDAYLSARKRFPREGKTVRTPLGQEKVIGIDIWRDEVTLLNESRQRRVVKLEGLRAEMAALPPDSAPGAPSVGVEAASGDRGRRRGRSRNPESKSVPPTS